jgi:CheY-like chemotaxis protein
VQTTLEAADCRNTILLIEDDPNLRESVQAVLEVEGYQVVTAEHGLEGLQRLDETGQPCLILLDLMMPVMNGWEFLETMQDRRDTAPQPPVVVVSAAAQLDDVQARFRCQVLRKPFDIDHLLAVAGQHCQPRAA